MQGTEFLLDDKVEVTNGLSQRQTKVAMKEKKRRRILQCRKAKAQWKGIGILSDKRLKRRVCYWFSLRHTYSLFVFDQNEKVSFNGQQTLNQILCLTKG